MDKFQIEDKRIGIRKYTDNRLEIKNQKKRIKVTEKVKKVKKIGVAKKIKKESVILPSTKI